MKTISVKQMWQRIKSVPVKQKIWALVLIIVAVYSLLPWGTRVASQDVKSRIQQVNMAQGKLCIMKIDAATCAYVRDDPTFKESYEACYEHNGEADVVIDLTKADVSSIEDGKIKVVVPDPAIDESTLNLRAGKFRLVKKFGGAFRSSQAKTKCDIIAEETMRDDFRQTVIDNFKLPDAKQQAVSVLHAMYGSLGVNDITIEFKHN